MMKFLRSIKFNVWVRFEAIVLAMLMFTYVFLVVLFPTFYEWMKTYEIAEAMAYIRTSWSVSESNFSNVVSGIARKNKMYIEITTPYYTGYVDYLGGSQSLSQLSKKEYQQAALNSDSGVYYEQFRDERENNTVLTMCTYIGSKSDPEAFIFICSYVQPVGTTVAIFQRQFLFVSLIMMMITLFVSVFFANRITNPIININKHAKELPHGKFDAQIDEHDFNEIKQLAGTLQDASKEIAKSDDLRRELMANISHDLRTPLTMIKAYAEMIRDISGDNPEKRERHLKVIIDETDRLSSLVNDILDLSKLQAGVTEMNMSLFKISEELHGVISRFDILRDNDGIIIELHAEDGIVISADITKLEQVIFNLINNAVTYTGDDNTVIVRLFRKQPGLVRFEVIDHGDGIAPENLPYIWDRYYRVSERNKTHKRAKMGSGIGLSIVKSVLEQHGFAFGADSTVGQGSTFWFEAPEYYEQPEPEPAPQKQSMRIIRRQNNTDNPN
ncbi:MAG: sensor histidine kinase [Oscillospiraceae bacterium]